MIKLVIFDLDGTLLNTLEDLADCTNYLLRNHHFPEHPLDSFRFFVGNGIPKLIERALPLAERHNVNFYVDEFIPYYQKHSADKTRPYQGIIPLLETLQTQNIKISVASNKVDSAMKPLMDYYFASINFDAYLGQRPYNAPKPAPDVVFELLKHAQVEKNETLYVGDTGVDVQTALNAGLLCVGALWGFRDEKELHTAGAHFLAQKPDDILAIMNQIDDCE